MVPSKNCTSKFLGPNNITLREREAWNDLRGVNLLSSHFFLKPLNEPSKNTGLTFTVYHGHEDKVTDLSQCTDKKDVPSDPLYQID